MEIQKELLNYSQISPSHSLKYFILHSGILEYTFPRNCR